jgi:hypothetical protein
MNFLCWLIDHDWHRYDSGLYCRRCVAQPYEDVTLPEWWLNVWRFGRLSKSIRRVRVWFRSRPCWFKDHEWSPVSEHCLRCKQSGIDVAEQGEWTLPVWKKLWRKWLSDLPRRIFGPPIDITAGKWYLAGPMSGLPQFNIPAFDAAAKVLRGLGCKIISPAELDAPEIRARYMLSANGASLPGTPTWGTFLARDVKIVADTVRGIVLLPGWEKSRGARLEAYVGLLCGHQFLTIKDGTVAPVCASWIKIKLWKHL